MRIEYNTNGNSWSAPVEAFPLEGDIKMTGFDTDGKYRSGGVFDGIYLWMVFGSDSNLGRYDTNTNEYVTFSLENGINGNYNMPDGCHLTTGIFDGEYIWLLTRKSNHLIRLNPHTGAMVGFSCEDGVNGNTNMPKDNEESIFNCGVYDGEHLWIGRNNGNQLIQVDPSTGSMKGITYSLSSGSVDSMLYDGSNLWMHNRQGILTRFNLSSGENKRYSNVHGMSCIFDGHNIWGVGAREIYKFDPDTEEITKYTMLNNVNGNTDLYEEIPKYNPLVISSVFDGKYIWLCPYCPGKKVVRLDCRTGTMKGFDLRGQNMGNWAETTAKSDEILFDGKSLWLIPNRADKLLKISRDTADLTTHTITETYHTTEDDQLRDPTTTQAEERSTYTKTAPTIPGYTCIGHRIDGGVQRSGDTATIEDVTGDHTVLFLYHKDDEGGGTDPGGDGCCCCCCKPNVNIYDNVFTVNVDSIENLNLFGCGSECCDTDCE